MCLDSAEIAKRYTIDEKTKAVNTLRPMNVSSGRNSMVFCNYNDLKTEMLCECDHALANCSFELESVVIISTKLANAITFFSTRPLTIQNIIGQ